MKFLTLFLIAVLSVMFSRSAFSQSPPENRTSLKINKIKTDTLREIQALRIKDQAYYYSEFGEIYFEFDQKESVRWITKAVEIALDPTTNYKDDAERLSLWWNILDYMWDEDRGLADRILAKIKQLKTGESDASLLKKSNDIYIRLAAQLFTRKYNEKMVLEFAQLSMKGKKPAVNRRAAEFFRNLKFDNEKLANLYFANLFETVKTSGDEELIADFVEYFLPARISDFAVNAPRPNISDPQMRASLELLLPFIENDAAKIALRNTDECGAISRWGAKFLADYQRLLPEKSLIVERANALCRNSAIEDWKKPDFQKKPRNTSQDWSELAKQITDRRIRADYLEQAAARAYDEKNFGLSNKILESIDKEFRTPFWNFLKIETISNWIEELYRKNELSEINNLLDNTPPDYVPFIIVKFLNSNGMPEPERQDFALNLMKTARAGFNNFDKFPLISPDHFTNPTAFVQLIPIYVKYGFDEESLITHEETIRSLNRLVGNLPREDSENPIHRISSYSDFFNETPIKNALFLDKYFDRIYANLGKIENSRIRVEEKLGFLRKVLRVTRTNPSRPY
jgi:hypothetical protein